MLIVAAVLVIVLSPSCSSDIDRSFGPEVLRGTGMLPGVVMSTSPPTGL